IVVIGAEGKWQKDELLTPFGPMPGAEVHLNVLNSLLHRESVRDLSPFARAVVTILTAILATAMWLSIRSPWLRLLALGGIDIATPFFALWFYNHQNLYLPCLAPLLALNSIVFFCLVSDFIFERIEKTRLRSTFQTRDDLTHMIVHDLRSPLTLVTGYVDILERMASDKLDPDEAECVTGAKRGADDMRDMITLCFVRIQFIRSHPFQYIDVAGNQGQRRAQMMNDHMGEIIPRLQRRPKSAFLDTLNDEIRN